MECGSPATGDEQVRCNSGGPKKKQKKRKKKDKDYRSKNASERYKENM